MKLNKHGVVYCRIWVTSNGHKKFANHMEEGDANAAFNSCVRYGPIWAAIIRFNPGNLEAKTTKFYQYPE